MDSSVSLLLRAVGQAKSKQPTIEKTQIAHAPLVRRTVQILDSSESRMGYRGAFPLIWRAVLQLAPGATMT
jgi:hypothetical protein